ncbi:hypothetical protein ACFL1X_01535 [Candidatus Hydrogenedentota bacterium]
MGSVDSLMEAMGEDAVARICIPFDAARGNYRLQRNTVDTFRELEELWGDFYSFCHASCVSRGGRIGRDTAVSSAKEYIEKRYRGNGAIEAALNDARRGTSSLGGPGGLRGLLDIILDGMKADAVDRYIRHVIDSHVIPEFGDKRRIIAELFDRSGHLLGSSVDQTNVDAHASDYRSILMSVKKARDELAKEFRRH